MQSSSHLQGPFQEGEQHPCNFSPFFFLSINVCHNPLLSHFNLHFKVMCDCYTPQGEPIPTNKRFNAAKIFSDPAVAAEVPWYSYILISSSFVRLFCFIYLFLANGHHLIVLVPNHVGRYGIEQEYTLLQKDVKWPLGWPVGGFPGPQVRIILSNV